MILFFSSRFRSLLDGSNEDLGESILGDLGLVAAVRLIIRRPL